MDILSFFKQHLGGVTPHIEAPIEGVWRLEHSRRLHIGDGDEEVYCHSEEEPDISYREFRSRTTCEFTQYTACDSDQGGFELCSGSGMRQYVPYTFDSGSGTLCCDGFYFWVERLDAETLILLNFSYLELGEITRHSYSRRSVVKSTD